MKHNFNPQCITYSQMNLIFNLRIAWRRLTTWTRTYIISRYVGIGTAEELFGRLYLEVQNFSDMIQVIFGREISRRNAGYLIQNTIILRDLITAHLEGNEEAVQQNLDRFYKNINETAIFLASVNPYWSEDEWRDMLETYLQYTIEQANAFSEGEYKKEIEISDRHTDLINRMGDIFAQGLYDYITSGAQNSDNLPPQDSQKCVTEEQMNQIYNIRMFWFDLIFWVRAFMLSRYEDVGNEDEVYARLQQVTVDYINNLNKIFGETPVANEYQMQLNAYIGLIDSLITAQKAGDTEEIDRITRLLYQNASDRAASISAINPYWDENEWRTRLNNNLRSTLDESAMFLTGDYARNLDIFSTLMNQAESSSDYFAQGVLNYLFQGQQQ